LWVDILDVIAYAIFGDNQLRDVGMAMGRISGFSIELRRRPYNSRTRV